MKFELWDEYRKITIFQIFNIFRRVLKIFYCKKNDRNKVLTQNLEYLVHIKHKFIKEKGI